MHKVKSAPDLRVNGKTKPSKNISVQFSIHSYLKKGDDTTYKLIHETLRKEPLNNELLVQWLHQVFECIPILDNRTTPLILDSLRVPWQKANEAVKDLFRNVIVTLVTTHNYHAYVIIRELFRSLIPLVAAKPLVSQSDKGDSFNLSDETKQEYKTVCQLIAEICHKVPLVAKEVPKIVTKCRPYYMCPGRVHVAYVYNLLLLGEKLPSQKREFLQVIIEDLICLDLHSSEEQFLLLLQDDMEEDDDIFELELEDCKKSSQKNKSPLDENCTTTLDMLMHLLIHYVHNVVHGVRKVSSALDLKKKQKCPVGSVLKVGDYARGCQCNKQLHDKDAAKELYEDLRHIFGEVVLVTKSTSHVQFLVFYLLSIRPSLTIDFLEFLKQRSFGPYSLDTRCTAVAYTASLICRASFITYEVLHNCMQVFRDWCSLYLQSLSKDCFSEGQTHVLFYYVCQMIMYTFTFNYEEYTKDAARLKDCQSLLLDALVHSELKPLTHCSTTIVEHFASVANHFQVAYCYALLEEAKRKRLPEALTDKHDYVPLEVFLQPYFPFDPYRLPRSKEFISNHYREFVGMPAFSLDEEDNECKWRELRSGHISSQISGMSLESFSPS